ncbi:MAG TPA: ATP-binding protein [Candidatus Krumholzibacteria bacterium]|nr:ATP-binding protein [Candidatus Krumholzibacteria bacterium]
MTGGGHDSPDRRRTREGDGADPHARLLLWRGLLAIFLTGSAIFVHYLGSERIAGPGLIGTLGLLYTSLAVAWAAQAAGAPARPLAAAQLAADTLCIGLLVQFTGGPFSAFPLMFCVTILLAARHHGPRGALTVAATAAIFTGGGHFGLALGWLAAGRDSRLDYLQGWPLLVTCLHMGIFLVTGLVAGDLARRLAARGRAVPAGDGGAEVRTILDNIRSGLLIVDAEGRVLRANPACCRVFDLGEGDLVGRDLRLVTAGGLEALADAVLPVVQGGAPLSRAEITVRRRGRELPLGLSVNRVAGQGGRPGGAIGIFADLTREKELAARVRDADRLAAVGELAASIAHEIRNPLASIRGSVEILAGDLELEGYQRQLLELVLKESARVNTIINDFLAYSRMRPAARRRFPAQEFRDELTLQVRQHIVAKNGRVGVTCDVYPENLLVTADAGQLTQMALNLAINACEAMDYHGQLKIALNLRDGGETCELVVSDTGPGIDPEIRDDLFRPFKTTKDGGTGLGLSIVARIAAAHGGSVQAGEAPGGGAVFRVRWPQDPADPARPAVAPALPAVAEPERAPALV